MIVHTSRHNASRCDSAESAVSRVNALAANHASMSAVTPAASHAKRRQLRARRDRTSATLTISARLSTPTRDPVANNVNSNGKLAAAHSHGVRRNKYVAASIPQMASVAS